MTSKQGYGPDLKKFMDRRLHVRLNGSRRITGIMIGYDHFMNVVLDQAQEHAGKEIRPLGKQMQDTSLFSPLISPIAHHKTPELSDYMKRTTSDFASSITSPAREFTSQDEDYEHCPNCSRKFFVGRLKLHLKSCKEGNAHKPVKNSKVKTIPERFTEDSVADPSKRLISHTNEPSEDLRKPVYHVTPSNVAVQEQNKVQTDDQEEKEEEEEEEEEDIIDLKDREKAEDGRVGCVTCGRLFHMNRIFKHEKACKKSSKKRPVFNTAKQRAIPEQGGDVKKQVIEVATKTKKIVQKEKVVPLPVQIEPALAKEEVHAVKEEDNKKKPEWKKQHENFIENIRFNRNLKQMEARGEDTTTLVAPTIVNENYVSCAYCFRKFAPATAERHIPKCKDIFNRPKPPKSLRLEKIEDTKSKVILRKVSQQPQQTEGPEVSPRSAELAQPISQKTQGKFTIRKTPVSETKPKQSALPSIRSPEPLENIDNGYEISYSPPKLRSFRSQSPQANREIKKVFSEPMPKKDSLLQNYQSLLARVGQYATECCPYCNRKFGSHAAERHIPVCKDMQGRMRVKNSDVQALFEDKKKPIMNLTSFTTKLGFNNKAIEENDTMYPKSALNGGSNSTNYKPFFLARKAHNSERNLVPIKKTNQNDSKEAIKQSLFQKPKLVTGRSHFCTSCGTKFAKVHNFCGQCGHKKDPIYIA